MACSWICSRANSIKREAVTLMTQREPRAMFSPYDAEGEVRYPGRFYYPRAFQFDGFRP